MKLDTTIPLKHVSFDVIVPGPGQRESSFGETHCPMLKSSGGVAWVQIGVKPTIVCVPFHHVVKFEISETAFASKDA